MFNSNLKPSFCSFFQIVIWNLYVHVAFATPPVAPDCPKLAIPTEFITANYSTPVVRDVSDAVIANGRAQVGGYAIYSAIGSVDGTLIDMKITFVSTSTPADPNGYIEFGVNTSNIRMRSEEWVKGVQQTLKVEYFVSGTTTPAAYSGVYNFSDIDQVSVGDASSVEKVFIPVAVVGSYQVTATTTLTVTTSGTDYVFAGTVNDGTNTNPNLAFSTVVENIPSFTMKLQNGGTSTTFFINGNDFNYIPGATCSSDQYTTTEDDVISRNAITGLLSNDIDLDGDALTISQVQGSAANLGALVTIASGSKIQVNADGSFTYNPNPAFDFLNNGQTRTDSFYYQVSDGHGGFDFGTASVTITGVNDAPVANKDFASVNKGNSVAISVLSNDTDVDGTVVVNTLSINTNPANGTVAVNTVSGVITYIPNAGFSGSDHFIYNVCDSGMPVLCDTAIVEVTVTNVCASSVPAAPTYPTSGTKTLTAGNLTLNGGDQGNYVFPGTTITMGILTVGVGAGNTVNIYVNAGQTLNLDNINLNNGNLNFYILNGGTLRLTSTVNAGNYYVYGVLNLNSNSLQIQNAGSLNIASSGIVYGGSIDLTNSAGVSYIEGLLDVSNFTIQKATGPAICINSSGCAKTNTVLTNNTLNSIQSELGVGYMHYNNTSGPCSVNQFISNTPSLNVCSKQTATCTAPDKWGTPTVTINCATPNVTCTSALPILLSYFKAKQGTEGTLLYWETSQEWDTEFYLIESSTDGLNWQEIGIVKSAGKSNKTTQYQLLDPELSTETTYYKLSEIDNKNNKKQYEIIVQENDSETLKFVVFPNPTNTGEIKIKINGLDANYDLEIVDLTAKVLYKSKISTGITSIDDLNLPSGIYVIRLKERFRYLVQKLIVQ